MAKTKQFHISSNVPLVYFMQALIVVTLVMVVSYGVFIVIFGDRYDDNLQVFNTNNDTGTIQLTPEAVAGGVSESDFSESLPKDIPSQELESLFPQVKN